MQAKSLAWKKFFLIAVVFAYFMTGYTICGQLLKPVAVINLFTSIDGQIPYIPFFAIFYMGAYFYIVYPVFLMRDTQILYLAAIRYMAIATVAFLFFYFLPNEMQRPHFLEPNNVFDHLLNAVFTIDSRFNTFPSLHVAFTVCSFQLIKLQRPTQRHAALIGALLIAASTLFTRQHMIADVIGGYVLAELVRLLTPYRYHS